MKIKSLLTTTAHRSASYLESLPARCISPSSTREQLLDSLGGPLPEQATDAGVVIDDLCQKVTPGLLHTSSPRFFGWVIGGTLPAAIAADALTTTWDQNAGAHDCSPSAAVIEEICGQWLKELFGLPKNASFALVSGCQMAHVTGLAAARFRLYQRIGWDIGKKGLASAPQIRVLSSENHHETFSRALRLLGLGTDCIQIVASDDAGKMAPDALRACFEGPPVPTIVCLQAGDLNTGTFDPFEEACAIAHEHDAWVHVDGAFGLWAQVSPKHAHLSAGIHLADSWATDGHKWLNVPYGSGYVFVADREAHRASMTMAASYVAQSGEENQVRNQFDWGPEWSRRARGFPTYAAIRSLGRSGISEMIARCCEVADALTTAIGSLPHVEIISQPTINQGLVRFLSPQGDHDAFTDKVIEGIVTEGSAWFGGVHWHGKRVMRISVCNWRTTLEDIPPTVAAIAGVLKHAYENH